jgi:hypothetical protein
VRVVVAPLGTCAHVTSAPSALLSHNADGEGRCQNGNWNKQIGASSDSVAGMEVDSIRFQEDYIPLMIPAGIGRVTR